MSFGKDDPTYRGLGGGRSRKLVVEMDGTGDYIEIGNHSRFNFTSGVGDDQPFSMSIWVQTENASDQGAFIAKNSGQGVPSNWLFYHIGGKIWAILYDGSGNNLNSIRIQSNASGLLNPGQWHNVMFTYDGDQTEAGLNLYLDGQPVPSTRDNPQPYAGLTATNSPVRIGANAASGVGNEFEKYMTEAVIYGNEVTPAQAVEIYNNGRPLDMTQYSLAAGLVSWWRMGDGDTTGPNGIDDSVGIYNGELEGDAKIVAVRDLR
jgi:hypothetical protein